MGYIHAIQTPDGNTHLIEPLLFTTLANNSETTALAVSIQNFTLTTGVSIILKMTVTNAASATLSVNGTAKPIYYKDAAVTAGMLKANHIDNLVYDGTNWCIVGEKLDNSEIQLTHKLTFGAGGTYIYDGSQDVTVPVFTGTIL